MANTEKTEPVVCWEDVPRPLTPDGWVWDLTLPCCLNHTETRGWIMIDSYDGHYVDRAGNAPRFGQPSSVPPAALRALVQRAKDVRLPGWA